MSVINFKQAPNFKKNNNLIYFKGRLNDKISRSLSACLEVWLDNGIRDGDILHLVYVKNPTVANLKKISVRTVLRAKNEAEDLGIIERYYDPVKQKECLKIFIRKLAEFLNAKGAKYLHKIFPNDIQKEHESRPNLVNESATINTPNDIEPVSESATPCRKPVSESATPCRTINLNTNNLINKKELFINKVKEACRESETVHPSDGHVVVFTQELIADVEKFVSNPPEWISSDLHAQNHILKQIKTGQYITPSSPDRERLHSNIAMIVRLAKLDNEWKRPYRLSNEHSYAASALRQANLQFYMV